MCYMAVTLNISAPVLLALHHTLAYYRWVLDRVERFKAAVPPGCELTSFHRVPWSEYQEPAVMSHIIAYTCAAIRYVADVPHMRECYPELCDIAIQGNPYILRFLHCDWVKLDHYVALCRRAVQGAAPAIMHIDPRVVGHHYLELCLDAVTECGRALQYIQSEPLGDFYPEVCLLAVTNDGLALQHVQNQQRVVIRCTALLTTAVSQNRHAVNFIET